MSLNRIPECEGKIFEKKQYSVFSTQYSEILGKMARVEARCASEGEVPAERLQQVPLPELFSPVMTRVCASFSWLGRLVTSTPLPGQRTVPGKPYP